MFVLRESQVIAVPVVSHRCIGQLSHRCFARAASYAKLRVIRRQHFIAAEILRQRSLSCRSRVHAGVVRAEISYIMVSMALRG